jgi:carnitine 3-dehydrogenase
MSNFGKVAVIGGGVIGSGWVARCLAHGLDVVVSDPAPDAEAKTRAAVENAWPSLIKLGLSEGASLERLSFTADLAAAVAAADFVQENVPEREALKRRVLAEIDAAARPEVVIGSSTSYLMPSLLQADCRHPERIVVGHPFNPVYLLPLVEVVGGVQTSEQAVATAMAFYESIGMHPLRVRKEIEGHISDRLLEAVFRESLHLLDQGVATTEDLDDAIVYGPGLRWAIMGSFLSYHLAGGDTGMRHFMGQFGPALKLPYCHTPAPELTDELLDRIVAGTEDQAAGRSVKELERLRNDCLIAIMQALRQYHVGAGEVLHRDEAARFAAQSETAPWRPGAAVQAPLALLQRKVDMAWIDYNGHMSEACYLTAMGDASDALFRYIGIDEAYRASGRSFYTVETHINYAREVGGGEPLSFTTQILGLDAKRLHLFHAMYHGQSGELLGSAEQMLLHVDMQAGRASPIAPEVHAALVAIAAAHAELPWPEGAGRQIGIPVKTA